MINKLTLLVLIFFTAVPTLSANNLIKRIFANQTISFLQDNPYLVGATVFSIYGLIRLSQIKKLGKNYKIKKQQQLENDREEALRQLKLNELDEAKKTLNTNAQEFSDELKISLDTNCFEILGIGNNATEQEIVKSYRVLSVRFHPDRSPFKDSDPEKATRLFNLIKVAKDLAIQIIEKNK